LCSSTAIPAGRIDRNFTWHELTEPSDPEAFSPVVHNNLKRLVGLVLQPLRDRVPFPIKVTSGWRDYAHNKAVGGHPSSVHMTGRAVDFRSWTQSRAKLDQLWDLLLASDTPFDKACKYSTFIHVHIAPLGTAPRRLTYLCKDGKTWTNRTHVPLGE
jgi:hypothetical protein